MESGICTQCATLVLERLDLILGLFLMSCVYSGKPDLVLVLPVTIFLNAAASLALSFELRPKADRKVVKLSNFSRLVSLLPSSSIFPACPSPCKWALDDACTVPHLAELWRRAGLPGAAQGLHMIQGTVQRCVFVPDMLKC